jgi:hypothetical protein
LVLVHSAWARRSAWWRTARQALPWIHRLANYCLPWSRAILFSIFNHWDHYHFTLDNTSLFIEFAWHEKLSSSTDLAQTDNRRSVFQNAHKRFLMKIPSAVFHNRLIHHIPYSQTFGFSIIWSLHCKRISSKSQNSFLRESMTFERAATIWIDICFSSLDRTCAMNG